MFVTLSLCAAAAVVRGGGAPPPVIIIDDHVASTVVERDGVTVEWCIDKDLDGYGDRNHRRTGDAADGEMYVANCDDCDDMNPDVYPNSNVLTTCDQYGHQCACGDDGDWIVVET